ncbi:MAG TPA: riboflavin synthase [Actinomycetota bacterium]|nr:riboflavin synthase [Actinomycetota bacterium]
MFTGIVEERGRVRATGPGPAGTRLAVECRTVAEDAAPGDSVAVNGVCLTVVDRDGSGLLFDLVAETLDRSALADLRPGDPVNLERPVTLMTRLGGHLVQGHVDGVGTIGSVVRDEGSAAMTVRLPDGLSRYLVEKGSIAVDGVSLTVASLDDGAFTVALVPHTLTLTTLGARRPGDRVNLEVDVVSKYVEKLVRRDR